MDLQELRKWVKQGEGFQLEFKKFLPDPEKLLREAIAFANAGGGTILIGVDDSGEISGIKDPDEAAEVFIHSMRQMCRPGLQFSLELIPVTRKRSVFSLTIPPSQFKPHLLFAAGDEKGQCFFRVKDRSIQASRELREILRHAGKNRNLKIEIGEKEKVLLSYLGQESHITLKQFARLAGISAFTASRTLVHLVRGNVLGIEPAEGEDLYYARLS